jgi:hypothetical protein
MLLQKVNPDGLFIVVGEDASAVSLNQARLAHSAIADNHNLENENYYTVCKENRTKMCYLRSLTWRLSCIFSFSTPPALK